MLFVERNDMKKIVSVQVQEDYKLGLTFSDGQSGDVDLSDLVGKGVFALWEDYEVFSRVEIGPAGELVWDDQVDLCPDALYLKVTQKQPGDVFPGLGPEAISA